MNNISKAGLSILTIIVFAVAVRDSPGSLENGALCGGRRYQRAIDPNDGLPRIGLNADGISGQFLVDYGTTVSSILTRAFGRADRLINELSLPDVEDATVAFKHFDMSQKAAEKRLGVIGTDILSALTVQITGSTLFVGNQPCEWRVMRARGLVPIPQKTFFSSDPPLTDRKYPNVPVVFLSIGKIHTWAQIDTGYDDAVYAHSVDINEALFQQLIIQGIALDHLADIDVSTCEGRESRHVYTIKDLSLVVETADLIPIIRVGTFYLILKPANGCGGIGTMSIPAAQLGVSFLRIFRTTVFDPQFGIVWLDGSAGVL